MFWRNPEEMERIEILGVPVDVVTPVSALQRVEVFLASDAVNNILAINPEKVIKAQSDPVLLQQFRSTSLLLPDGIGVVLAARLLHLGRPRRVPGVEMMASICELAARKGTRLFLFGARPEVNQKAVAELRRRHPGIQIVGSQHGYVDEEDMASVVGRINASGAEVLFVALGSPRQEQWIERFSPELRVKVCQGVGGSFDVLAGTVRRAPRIFCALSLEWLYRLLAQPMRAGRQRALPVFTGRVLRERFRLGIRRDPLGLP
jgi:N-acetylglucosaminyldiphosphoundecaprenol N-acetyl-beta-D-mannosaminyltransferase